MNRRRGLHRRAQIGLAIASVSAFAISTARAQTPVLAGPLLNPANGHAYYLLAEDDWQRSEATAVTLGGHLVTVNDAAEQAWVFETFGNLGGTSRSLWIGLTDAGDEGRFRWADGDAPAYSNWLPGQPDNSPVTGGEHFVHMLNSANEYGHPGGFWNDLASPNTTFSTFNPVCGVVEVPPPARVTLRFRRPDSPGSAATLLWDSQPGVIYQLETSPDLHPDSWSPIGSPIAGNGLEASVLLPAPDAVAFRAFRVQARHGTR